MNARLFDHTIRWESWQLSEEADRRFRRIVLYVGIPAIVLVILSRVFQGDVEVSATPQFDTSQYVELLPDAGEVTPEPETPAPAERNDPEPPKQAKAPEKPQVKPVEKPPAPTKPVETARDVAAKSGLLALSKELSTLRDQSLSTATNDQPLNTSAITSKGGIGAASGASADAIAASASASSGGIGSAGSGDVTSTQSGSGVGSRRTGTVKSPLATGNTGPKGSGPPPSGRTLNEIKLTFDKNAGPFYAIFNRFSRENPNIARGTIRIKLVIAPDGSVTSCTLVSSTYNEPDFENKIVQRAKLLNFGAKNVPVYTTDYPIYFIPQ